jgi:flagellar hook assembly protein FlgD
MRRAALTAVITLRVSSSLFADGTTLHLDGPPATLARVLIFDAAGRLVRTAWEGSLDGREVTISWDGKDQSGREVPAGIYLLRAQSPAGEALGRLVKTQ